MNRREFTDKTLALSYNFIAEKHDWNAFYTCADWAEEGFFIASGETISSSDYCLFGTPRSVAGSIAAAEKNHPTQIDIPCDGGEDASSSESSSITSESSEVKSSFPDKE